MNARRQCSGISLMWVLLTLMLMLGFVALAVDVGYMVLVGQQLQTGADAGALAGALLVRGDVLAARTAAVNVALANSAGTQPIELEMNLSNDPEGDIVVGRYIRETRTFVPRQDSVNAVKVVARRTADSVGGPLSLFFAAVLGHATAEMQRYAIAMTGGGTGKGMILLSPHDECALYIFGDTDVYVNGGIMHVNSDDPCAACYQGSILVDAVSIDAVGDHCILGAGDILTDLKTGQDVLTDPLIDIPAPPYDPLNDLGTVNLQGGSLTIQPGYYSGGISTVGGTLTLEPGIYVVDGAGLDVGGNANLVAEGVMFYVMGTGAVNIGGTGAVTITPPDPDEYSYPGVTTYEGLIIFQARDNTNESTIIGTSLMNLEGTLYFPNNHVEVGGTATRLGSQFIAYTTTFFGNGEIMVAYEGNVAAPGGGVYIVE